MRRLGLLALVLACSSSGDGSVHLAPTLIFPQGVLDGVTRLNVSVYDGSGSLDCNANDGTVKNLNGDTPLATKDLQTNNCPSGAKFCGDISVDKSGSPRLFAAQGFVGNSASPQTSGCTKVPNTNQDTLNIQIKMLRTLPPQICNGKTVPNLVQCATGPNDVCDANCQSIEYYFSKGDGTTTSDVKAKVRPQLVWPATAGDPGRLIGVWGDKSPAGGNEVAMRVLADDMQSYAGQSLCIQTNSFRMPGVNDNNPCPPTGYPLPQFNPTVASINGNYYIAFEDGSGVPATAIKMRSLDPILNPQQASAVVISGSNSNAQALPSMAANGNNLYVAWEDGTGKIVGTMVASSNLAPAGAPQVLGTGSGASVAATSSGWVVVWQAGTDVQMNTISSSGAPGTAAKVNTNSGATHPGVAAFGANVCVVWADGNGDIRAQRFDGSGKPIANDQNSGLEDTTLGGNQSAPSVAAGTNFFIATWVDGKSGHVRGRFLDGVGGFMYNLVNGQNGDFQVSVVDNETRNNPVAVVGGNQGQYVAIAWEDNTGSPGSFKGIWGRRFPLPQ
jgi:hypothetical protein